MTQRIAFKWGIILGIAVCLWTLWLHALGWYTADLAKGQIADQIAIVLPIVVIFLAIREHSLHVGRAPTIREALGTGVLTGMVSIPLSAGFLWLYHHFINRRWNDLLIAYERERLTREGASAEEIARRTASLASSATDSAQILSAIAGTLLLSAVISVLVWGWLRMTRRRRQALTSR